MASAIVMHSQATPQIPESETPEVALVICSFTAILTILKGDNLEYPWMNGKLI